MRSVFHSFKTAEVSVSERNPEKSGEIAGRPVQLTFIVKDPNEGAARAQSSQESESHSDEHTDINLLARKSGLHDGLTFETFVTGNANRVARSSAELVAQFPGEKYNRFLSMGLSVLEKLT